MICLLQVGIVCFFEIGSTSCAQAALKGGEDQAAVAGEAERRACPEGPRACNGGVGPHRAAGVIGALQLCSPASRAVIAQKNCCP